MPPPVPAKTADFVALAPGDPRRPPALAGGAGRPSGPVYVRGAMARLAGPFCAVVGSRRTPPRLLDAAFRLGAALSDAGYVVASGGAKGADAAAHAGAAAGKAGTLVVPACGLDAPGVPRRAAGGETWLGLAPPAAPFAAATAVRRNYAIADISCGVVLVASGAKGGSWYAVRRALESGKPVWCFEDGEGTPEGNASLIRARLARPLSLRAGADRWVAEILDAVAEARRAPSVAQPVFPRFAAYFPSL